MVVEQVATRLVLDGANDEEVTRPVSMVGANSVEVSAVKLEGSTTVKVYLQESNDQENWFERSTQQIIDLDSGAKRATVSSIGFAWVRIRFANPNTAGTNVISCTVSTS